jgi:hypothetical protein
VPHGSFELSPERGRVTVRVKETNGGLIAMGLLMVPVGAGVVAFGGYLALGGAYADAGGATAGGVALAVLGFLVAIGGVGIAATSTAHVEQEPYGPAPAASATHVLEATTAAPAFSLPALTLHF